MKKSLLFGLVVVGLVLITACNKDKKSEAAPEKVTEIVEKAFKDMSGKEKFVTVLKDAYKLSFDEVVPWADVPEKSPKGTELFLGDDNMNHTVVGHFMKPDGSDISKEEYKTFVRKMYDLSKERLAQDGKNVKGFMLEDKLEKALEEKTFDALWASEFWPQQWNFRMGDEFYDFTLELNDSKTPNNIRMTIGKTLQKSMKESMEDVEKALEREDVQKAIKDALKK